MKDATDGREPRRIEHALRWRVLSRDDFRCVYCGRSADRDGVVIVVDHIIPRSAGGETRLPNLAASCSDCNQAKADSVLVDDVVERLHNRPVVGTWNPNQRGEVKYGAEVLTQVMALRSEGYGYKRIGRAVGCSRDVARDLVRRAAKGTG